MGLDIHIGGTLNSIILQEFGNVTSPLQLTDNVNIQIVYDTVLQYQRLTSFLNL